MEILTVQKEIRTVYQGGFAGQLVSSVIWFLSSAAATWYSHAAAIYVLAVGGAFIFPLTQLLLRWMGRPASLPKGHPMNALATQIAFTLPMTFPLIYAATAYHLNWFYPAFMIAVGAHYLPFVFLYGMAQFGILSALVVMGGTAIGVYLPGNFSLGGWITAGLLLVFALMGRRVALSKRS